MTNPEIWGSLNGARVRDADEMRLRGSAIASGEAGIELLEP